MRRHLLDREPGVADGRDGGSDAAFWASPVGQAARAKLRGDRFFQIEVDHATLSGYAETTAPVVTGRRARRTCDLLGQIEELGWHLEHASWWRADGESPVQGDFGAQPHHDGQQVRGVYLFHCVPAEDADDPPTAAETSHHARRPTHRREVS